MKTPQMSTIFGIEIQAMAFLIELYLKEPGFNKEFHDLMNKYIPIVDYCLLGWINSHQTAFTIEQYKTISQKLSESISDHTITEQNVDEYLSALGDLAWKWKLRTPSPLAGFFLFLRAFTERLFSFGELTIYVGSGFHPLSAIHSLHLTIPDWDMIELGQTKLLKKIKLAIKDYAKQVKKAGVKNFPYELERHASWWFEHYVKEKPYTEIDLNPETVRRKVWDFRKLLNISLK
jgi:hypothetical protein